ncbi:hypothetical protein P280DRAFT_458678 [Massarina eburnea CBS 473.64]|uniref:PAC domain-containing protein n=1 Tax=Massarina eburnea CBS 473.64 TaxID=1395130 RepID=A0A6A6RP77_9PLEO|nr:hypothetical protein P280DRAFT_458678 [Massarina eburnea CBS 473.64]
MSMDDLSRVEPSFNKLPQIDSASDVGQHRQSDTAQEYERSEHTEHSFRPVRDPKNRFSIDESSAYDLKPPPPTGSDPHCEVIVERLFSTDHLHIILKEPAYFQRFRGFLNKYRPQCVPTLIRYLESQKALTAIRYANALADQMSSHSPTRSRPSSKSPGTSEAAMIDSKFENFSKRAVEELVSDALPAYITYRMVTLVTECLVKEITGGNTPLMRDLIQGLAEVYCMSDPKQPDNPIVFASEEFYNTTQYGHEYVIGKNCRFLQGQKTQRSAVKRISSAIHNGQEISEILLNYRRDGSPFLNLVMTAPLHDSRGHVRYYIGAQIDISHLLEGGRGLESFERLLVQDEEGIEKPKHHEPPFGNKPSTTLLHELSGLLNDEEIEAVKQRDREGHALGYGRPESIPSAISTPTKTKTLTHNRRFVGMDDTDDNIWPPSLFGANGRLPGVYQNYLLVRPYPSLRIIFTSPALRIPGLAQSKLMDRIGGPQHVREGLLDAFSQGIGVTAKISWLTQTKRYSQPTHDNISTSTGAAANLYEGRPRWIHCTPLMGSDSQPGVIMIVMVDKEEITGTLSSQNASVRNMHSRQTLRSTDHTREGRSMGGPVSNPSGAARFTGSKLYADYLRREGKPAKEDGEGEGPVTSSGVSSLHSPTPGSRATSLGGRNTPVPRCSVSLSARGDGLTALPSVRNVGSALGRSASGWDGSTVGEGDGS